MLLLFAGPAAILHAALAERFVELGSGISITVWTCLVWFWVISLFYIDYAEVGYIKQFPTSHILTWLSIAPNALWGSFMIADGVLARKKTKA